MQKLSGPITFSGCVRLKSLIVIQTLVTKSSTVFDIVKGKWELPTLSPDQILIERPQKIDELNKKLRGTNDFTKILRLTGELGVGKTFLALQYAQQKYAAGEFQSVIWMDVQDFHSAALEAQWMHLAAALGITQNDTPGEVIKSTYQHLLSHGPTLVIFDGAESYSVLAPYLNFNSPNLHVIITSRNGIQWTYQGTALELTPFNEEQAITYLRKGLPTKEVDALAPKFKSLAFKVNYHPLRLVELCAMLNNQSISTTSTVQFQAQFDLSALQRNAFDFQLLQYCSLLCPYQNISLKFFERLYSTDDQMQVIESICKLKQRGLIGYPEQPSTYYIPAVLSHITKPDDVLLAAIKLVQNVLYVTETTPSATLLKHLWQLTLHVIDNTRNCDARLQSNEQHHESLQSYVRFFNAYLDTPSEEKSTQLLNCFNR